MRTKRPKLHAELRHLMRSPLEMDVIGNFIHDPDFVGVMAAGYLLRRNFQERLVDPTVNPIRLASTELPKHRFLSRAQRMLYTIINSSLKPQQTELPNFAERPCLLREGACRRSEVYFANVILSMQNDLNGALGGCRIISNDGRPILLQKSYGERTALSLEPLAIEGVEYPAGSLMALNVERDYVEATKKYRMNIDPGKIEIAAAEEVVGLSFVRPTLLAFNPSERNSYLAKLGTACVAHHGTAQFLAQASLRTAVDVATSFL